jgi:hypothetical protein
LGDNIATTNKNMETLIDASKEVGLEINIEKTKYMLLSHHQNVGKSWNTKRAYRSFKNVSVQIFGDYSNKSKFDSRGD